MRFREGTRRESAFGRSWSRRSTVYFAAIATGLIGAGVGLGTHATRSWAEGRTPPAVRFPAKARPLGHAQIASTTAQRAHTAFMSYGKLPLSFEPNRGQTASRVEFLARGRAYTLFLTRNEAVLALTAAANASRASAEPGSARHRASTAGDVFRMRLLNANPDVRITGHGEQAGKTNYFLGNDPRQWRTNIPNYSQVEYAGIYSGVDLTYYGNNRQLEYDFRLAPGADPNAIALGINDDSSSGKRAATGLGPMRIAANGDLVIPTATGEIRLRKPSAYQLEPSGSTHAVKAHFVVKSGAPDRRPRERRITFSLGPYNHNLPLVIDPVLAYSTFLGGSSTDSGYAVAIDASGNAHVAGATASVDFPCPQGQNCGSFMGGPSDIFVAELDSAGATLLHSTYIGGSGTDQPSSIALDSSGDAYLTGQTDSNDFPTTAGAYQTACGGSTCGTHVYDAFFTKLNADGSTLDYSTYLGGPNADQGYGIAVDGAGNAYVVGLTSSTTFPVTSGAYQTTFGGGSQDAFVSELNPGGKGQADLLYSTYLGGNGTDEAEGIALGPSGNVFVAGQTVSTNFPTTPGAFNTKCGTDGNCNGNTSDAFVSKLALAGGGSSDLLYSTYLGGSGGDEAKAIAVDSSGNVFVTGDTLSADFPTKAAFQPSFGGGTDGFVAKIKPAGAGPADLVYSTYLGGSDEDQGNAVAVDALGDAYVAGMTGSADFPVTTGALQGTCGTDGTCDGGLNDAFVTVLTPDGSGQIYSTYLGGAGDDEAFAAALDSFGDLFVTGSTASPGSFTVGQGFPVTMGAFQTSCGTDGNCNAVSDAFLAKLSLGPVADVSPSSLDFGQLAVGSSSASQTVTLTNDGVGTLSITSIAITGGQAADFAETNTCGSTLAPNVSCTISVTFKPTSIGAQSSSLAITDNAPGSPHTLGLSGTGTSQGAIQLSPAVLSFGNQTVGTTSAAQSVTVMNTGASTITVNSITASAPFATTSQGQSNYCGATIAPGASCTVGVTFSPTTAGAQSGTLTVMDNDTPNQQTVSLSGTGAPGPAVSLSPASLAFGNQALKTTSAAMTSTLTNSGGSDLSITSISITGTNASDFAETNTCPTTKPLSAGADCAIRVTFTPSASGDRSAAVTVTDDAPSSPQAVAISGIGTAPVVSLSPSSLTFMPVDPGKSSLLRTTLSNTGNGSLAINSIAVGGANSGDFAETNTCGSTVSASSSCVITVTFTPAAAGSRSGTISISDNASNSPQTVALSGTGNGPQGVLSPQSVPFGGENVGTSSSASTVTLSNPGNATLSITSISIAGANAGDFAETNTCGSTVLAGKSCTISVTFTPTAGGSRSASLDVNDNALTSPQSVSLTGSGKAFSVAASPGSVSVAPGTSANYTLTLTPLGGFDEMVQVSCTGAPSESTCTASPAAATLNGSSPTDVAITVATTAPSAAPPIGRIAPPLVPWGKPLAAPALWLAALGLLGVLSVFRRRRALALLAMAALSVVMWASCGSSTVGGGGNGGGKSGGTPAGTYTITLTSIGGNQTHTTTVSLKVQ
jgi:HYDIN/CFA65/VesB-like, Ig-like domain/Beta-propeller repeat/Cep192 domain 4/Abnormal spindle-like microcephaly-assoc'd, ASPM-SPD-2-Hydin